MSWLLLIAGLALWAGSHLGPRLAQGGGEITGSRRKIAAAGVGLGLLLIILGYRWTPFVTVWTPPSAMVHINNLLMLVAVFVFGMSATKGRLRGRLRHPQLIAVKIWALAHLLVNGDLASILMFGTLLVWAVAEVIVINRTTVWDRPAPGPASRDIVLVVITVVMFALITGLHALLGVWPFPG